MLKLESGKDVLGYTSYEEVIEDLNQAILSGDELMVDRLEQLADDWIESEFELIHGFKLP